MRTKVPAKDRKRMELPAIPARYAYMDHKKNTEVHNPKKNKEKVALEVCNK